MLLTFEELQDAWSVRNGANDLADFFDQMLSTGKREILLKMANQKLFSNFENMSMWHINVILADVIEVGEEALFASLVNTINPLTYETREIFNSVMHARELTEAHITAFRVLAVAVLCNGQRNDLADIVQETRTDFQNSQNLVISTSVINGVNLMLELHEEKRSDDYIRAAFSSTRVMNALADGLITSEADLFALVASENKISAKSKKL